MCITCQADRGPESYRFRAASVERCRRGRTGARLQQVADLPKLASNDRIKATPEEAKAIVGGMIAYAGTYSVDEPSKTISLRLEVTSFPNQATESKRTITSLSGDELKLTNPTATAGGKVDVTLKRAAAATN